jgi:undecaprenyl-diphosphatase
MNSVIIFVAKYFVFLSILVAAVFWLRVPTKEKISLGWRVIVGGILAEALAQIAGHLYYDTRPFVSEHIVPLIAHAPDNGFPSDHALLASFLGFVVLRHSRATGLLLLLIAILIGWARVLAHIHHPIDIVGSFAIAAFSVAVVELGVRLWKKWRRDAHHESPVA